MNETLVHTTAGGEASIAQLADVALPPAVPWTPQTVGWEVLGVLAVLLALFAIWRLLRRYRRNRYRREALAELKRIEAQWTGEAQANVATLVALPELVKRCALAAWPREAVAGLSGARWADFVVAHAGHATHGAQALAPLLRELQYGDAQMLSRVSRHDVEVLLVASRQWIEGHERHVPA